MNSSTQVILFSLLFYLLSLVSGSASPNIVFIFIDDIGWGDLSCYGSTVVDKQGGPITPHMDALAAEGILFTQGYVAAPVCSPSRVGVLTGIEPSRFAIHDFLSSKAENDNRNMNDWLDEHAITSSRWFQQAGYATGMFGKWHMGGGRDVNDAPFPQDYGFDESLTSFEGMGDRILYLDNGNVHNLSQQNADVPGATEWVEWELGADKHTDAAIDFITRAVNDGKPFYVHVPHDDTHSPYDTDPGKENDFDHITNNNNGKLFLSELHELDHEIGRLVDAIDALGVASETLIVLVGDNGAPEDNLNTLLNRNGGLRGGKKRLWEGGLRNPFIVRMPGTVPAGVVNNTTAISTLDLFPTYCALAELPLPQVPFTGENMLDVLQGSARLRSNPMYWEFASNPNITAAGPKLAMREGDFKLLQDPDGTNRHFFNVVTNKEELNSGNLINDPTHAATIASMEERLLAWYQEALLGDFENPRACISEMQRGSTGEVESVRLFWDVTGGDWLPPEFSNNLTDWIEASFEPSDAEMDLGTQRWLNIELPEGFREKAFFRAPLDSTLPPTEQDDAIYLVSATGEIRAFTGISSGATPVEGNSFSGGFLVTIIAGYGSYQGFTQTLDGEVYGVAANGDVHQWNSLRSWLDGDAPATASSGAYQAGELHGVSYDGSTGGFFVIYEGDNSSRSDGALGEYANLTDFVNDANAVVTPSIYGGNLMNFYYPAEDAAGNINLARDGANYFQISGAGVLEGWLTLADYAVNRTGGGGREFLQAGYGGLVGGFAQLKTAPLYFVSDGGEIRRFSGMSAGSAPVDGNGLNDGVLLGTVISYGSYQGFTQLPGGAVYGVAGNGDVHQWATLQDWLNGTIPTTASVGAYNAGELHGISYDGTTGGIYVIYEGDNSSRGDGDLGEYATLTDFIADTNAMVTESTYGGNILNFYYPLEDAPGNDNDALAGSNYFQVAGSGVLEGWLTLADYAVNKTTAQGREYFQTGFGGTVGAFAEYD